MGRPGGGGSHSAGRSGGSHSVSRSSGGHRVGSSSSSRPRGGSSSSFGGSRPSAGRSYGGPAGGAHHGHYAPPPPRHYGRPPRRGYRGGCLSDIMAWITVIILLVVFMIIVMVGGAGSSGKAPASSYNREKLDSGNGYINDCIYDELGWFDNESRTESKLKEFYNETGVQPYIALLDYNPELRTDDDKLKYAENWYEDNIDNESTFLYVYFAEEYEDDYSEPGYMCYVNGIQVSSVMDSEAVDIFWSYLDKYWVSDLSTDDMFVKTFTSTADRIMTKTTTSKDIVKYVLVVVAAGIVVFGVIKVVKLKHQRAKEEAEETERILNTPIESLVDAELKETAKKYDDGSQSGK